MNIQIAIQKLQELGQMPDEVDENATPEIVDKYNELLDQIERPVNFEEAEILIKLFPPDSLYRAEWTLLHAVESVYAQISYEKYRDLIEQCSSKEWKSVLITRLDNLTERENPKILLNILKERKDKGVTTTMNVWVSGNPISFVYTDEIGNWYFSDKDGEIDEDESFLITLEAILELDESLKTLPEMFPSEKLKRVENEWIKY